jgi:hypothetical protein
METENKDKKPTNTYMFVTGLAVGGIGGFLFRETIDCKDIALISSLAGLGMNPPLEMISKNLTIKEAYQKSAYYTLGMMLGASTVKTLEYICRL